MDLYFLKGYKEYAATNAADCAALATALLDPSKAANLATIDRVMGKIDSLVQSDSGEPLNFYFYETNGTTVSSWATDPAITVVCGLGTPTTDNINLYTSTTGFTIAGNARVATLPLNTTQLANALANASAFRSRQRRPWPGFALPGDGPLQAIFFLQVRKTTAGRTETVALLGVDVEAGVLTADPTTILGDNFRLLSVLNGYFITTMTGGSATALDGLDAGSLDYPVGCVVLTSNSDVGREWILRGTYIDATDLDAGKVKPVNSDPITNPCYWQML